MIKVKMDSNEVDLLIRNYNLTMRCLPSGTGLQYKWSRRNGSIPASAVGVDTSTLTIYRLTPEDAGDYQCILSNISGVIASEFDTLKVTGMGLRTCIYKPYFVLGDNVHNYAHIYVTRCAKSSYT